MPQHPVDPISMILMTLKIRYPEKIPGFGVPDFDGFIHASGEQKRKGGVEDDVIDGVEVGRSIEVMGVCLLRIPNIKLGIPGATD